jgi:hypothetical protein
MARLQDLELNDRDHGAWTLWGFAALAFRQGRMERALKLIGAALALWDSVHAMLPPAERGDLEQKRAEATAAVGAEAANALLAAGRALSFADADASGVCRSLPLAIEPLATARGTVAATLTS